MQKADSETTQNQQPRIPTPWEAAMRSVWLGPGAGQFLVGRRLRGTLFLSVFLVSLVQLFYRFALVVQQHWAALTRQTGNEAITAFVRDALQTDAGALTKLLILLWIVSIVDAWVMAWVLQRQQETANDTGDDRNTTAPSS